ncbi:hypothetical protein N7448_000125 [Penicillium atrosanguineum]|nr:hypothetical protein N7448_000125 [Penicillium atrosanguineum]
MEKLSRASQTKISQKMSSNWKTLVPPDGGTAAWLVVLGAWCCSFSSPGWVNSTYFYDLYNVFLASRYVASDINAMG